MTREGATREGLPHLPRQAAIDAYGNGGFRFAEMSHRGSLLCLPGGVWASAVTTPQAIDRAFLDDLLAAAGDIDLLIVGTGTAPWAMPADLRHFVRSRGVAGLEVTPTGAAVRLYNIVLAEGRRVAAALLAVS